MEVFEPQKNLGLPQNSLKKELMKRRDFLLGFFLDVFFWRKIFPYVFAKYNSCSLTF
jgi:hypothetical protein